MGFFDGIKNGLGRITNPPEDDYENDGFGYNGEDDYVDGFGYSENEEPGYTQPASTQQRPTARGMGLNSGALEMKVVKPEKYDSATAQKIADHLINKRTVVLNLESTNKESARRLIDFLSGVAYSISGYIQRVAANTFIIVPENVDISGEQLQEVRKQDETDLY